MSQKFTKEQQLLIEEIINKGYNQEDFEYFVLQKEPEKGHDLSEWTYGELLSIIQQYQLESIPYNINQEQDQLQVQTPLIEPESPEIIGSFSFIEKEVYAQNQKQEAIKIVHLHLLYNQNDKMHILPYEKTIKCKQLYFFIDENVELQFEISAQFSEYYFRPIEERGGILDFFSKQIVFPIQVNPMEWKIKRTLQDFAQLRNVLCAAFPEFILPSFPYKDIDDYDIIMKEQQNIIKVLTIFLQIYNKKPIIRTIAPSLHFLNETNPKQFQSKFYNQQTFIKQYNLNQKQSKTGTLSVQFNQNQYQKYKDYYSYLNSEQANYDIIQKHLEQFAEFTYKGQQNLGFSIEMIQQLCVSLPQYFEAQEFGKALSMIKSHFQTQKDFILRSTKQIMDVLLITLVKFKNSRQQLFELKSNLNETFQNFSNEFFLLEKRKEELFTLKDLQKWGLNSEIQSKIDINRCFTDIKYAKEIMLPKETFYVNEKRDQYVYMLNHFNEQFDQQFMIETDKLLNEVRFYLDNMRYYTNNQVFCDCETQLQNWDFLIQEYEVYKFQYSQKLSVNG
ncbi:unnamed protein product (macronuclear) [Paramecium tetraurelia]|uniref:PX domain-containing protein n=1 Tax=Paramecium tetraurelia TaxID=5888 RepID=A0BSX9_PARTE|nr:uncharacterized protein GSPATT00031878001 [Paramecium tetraurelia]CAK61646.1 unnamed protein product [Paramecium tetraurelia]|eukprot:XP_001429044.1 hypothetical protein (macronuclear) [Paramecium tetraurelia strain d4-2]